MNQYLRAYCMRSGMRSDKPGSPIPFVASTEEVARDGMIIESAGWQLNSYRSNNVVLWAHRYDQPPIGRADARVEGQRLMADITFDLDDPLEEC